MNKLMAILIILLIGVAGVRFAAYYKELEKRTDPHYQTELAPPVQADAVPELPPKMQASLDRAKARGVDAFRAWLEQYGRFVPEPALSEIQLDYVVMIGRSNPPEARRVFARVRRRNSEGSPVYDRIQKLAKTYE